MKRIIALISASALTAACLCTETAAQNISIFCDHIETIARQEGISFAEAAAKVKEIGYKGVDVRLDTDADKLKTLQNLGFSFASAIANIDWAEGPQQEQEEKTLKLIEERHFSRLLLVTGFMERDSRFDDVMDRVAAFAEKTAALGTVSSIEDFDHPKSPTFTTRQVGQFLDASDKLGYTFDTGNCLLAGEDCVKALQAFSGRITHVHLKDRMSQGDYSCPPVGEGCIPMTGIIKFLLAGGYDGWFTVEQFGSKNMLKDAENSYRNVLKAITEEEMTPQMTEYYYPAVPVLKTMEVQREKPKDAKWLFNGKNLSAWCMRDGSDAAWTVNPDKTFTVNKKTGDIMTREEYGSFELHVEWMIPEDIDGSGQARGNSGVYLQNLYEVQILDSYCNPTYIDGMAGSLYKQSAPLANPCRKPGEWNVYDISFTAPVLDKDGSYIRRPKVSVYFNGVLVQDEYELLGTTEYIGLPRPVTKDRGPILLQMHGDPSKPISFRNIWIRER